MTTTAASIAAHRIARPFALQLGPVIGIEMQRHYGLDFFLRRTVQAVDQKSQIALIDPPVVLIAILPSETVHLFRAYVVDEGQDVEMYRRGASAYTWRYSWLTLCGKVAMRVSARAHEVVFGSRMELYAALPPFRRLCRHCGYLATRDGTHQEIVTHD